MGSINVSSNTEQERTMTRPSHKKFNWCPLAPIIQTK